MDTERPFAPKRIVVAAARRLGARCLRYLAETMGPSAIIGVLTEPEGTAWWRDEPAPSIYDVVEQYAWPRITQPELAGAEYDALVSILWEHVFPTEVIAKAESGAINLHPGPLPSYRGCFTRVHAIMNREAVFGVTIHEMTARVDEGAVLAEITFPVLPDDTAAALDRRAMEYGFSLFCETWQRLRDGSAMPEDQRSIALRLGRPTRYFDRRSLSPYLTCPRTGLSSEDADRLYRGLSFPPLVNPPEWLSRHRHG